MNELRRQRAQSRRARAVICKTEMGSDADCVPISGPEAISLVTELTRESWSLSGKPLPTYTRERIPWRFVPNEP